MKSPAEPHVALLGKAIDDLYVLERLFVDEQAADWVLGFHAQQAVEKALKAVLAHAGIVFPRTHNLSMLLELLNQAGLALPPNSHELAQLTPFGVVARYEDALDDELTVDRAYALHSATDTVAWAKAQIAN